MEDPRKGTVTPLASLLSAEEAQQAVKRVEDAIAEKHDELDRIRGFVTDNTNLINLVQKLPEDLSHDIMVPFGKAAFFPGRLIHTNEFLVLLGEGYYAERTSKKTVEILKRRGKALDSHADSLEAMVKDLRAEASFFIETASEAAEGLVEIREDYVEEDSNKMDSISGPLKQDPLDLKKARADDEEYARMMARLEELEKEELAAESGDHNDQNEKTTDDVDDISYQRPVDNNLQNSEDFHQGIPLDQANNKSIATVFAKKHNNQDVADQLNFACMGLQSNVEEGKSAAKNVISVDHSEKLPVHHKEKMVKNAAENVKSVDHSEKLPIHHEEMIVKNAAQNVKSVHHSEKLPIHHEEKMVKAATASKREVQHQTAQPSFDSRKAFTGSIIEHTENLKTTSKEQSSTSSQVSGSQPSKPVSRFKMRR